MSGSSYAEFLASKRRDVNPQGAQIEPGDVSPVLFDWQREVVHWAVNRGRAALFEDCGLGKTFQQLEWARLSAVRALILAPLSVARQTSREAEKLGTEATYVRHPDEVNGPGIFVTNYEMAHLFPADLFGAIVLDESSILKNVEGSTRRKLTEQFASVPARLACTATPAPNDVAELCNHAEFLGIMPRNEMLAAFFVHDEVGWRIKGHATVPMYEWMAQWAVAMTKPSDIGYPDDGYQLPELTITPQVVQVDIDPGDQLFATDLGGVGGRAKVRRVTLAARCELAAELANSNGDQWIIWCGLNDEADRITKAVTGAVNVDGSMAPEDKAHALEAFQDGAIRVLVTKPAIAGFGMNFQQCHRMAFVGLSDSYEAYYQAIRRCYRFGQTEPVDVHIVVSELERQIVDNVARKETEAAITTAELVKFSPLAKETPNGIEGPEHRPAAVRGGGRTRRMLASTARR